MTQQEFLDKLRRNLMSGLEYNQVNSHINYYENYIQTQLRNGRSEEDVMEELGDPRLIAKTILDTAGKNGGEPYILEEEPERAYHSFYLFGKEITIPEKLYAGLKKILIWVVVILGLAFLIRITPYILLICFGFYVYRKFIAKR